jgi:predicted transposase YdaD
MPKDDACYKLMFSHPELVRDLVLGFVPDPWLESLDYSTLEQVPGSYVTDDLRQRASDVVWRLKANGDWIYLYLLIEFQSTVDPYMAVRMMTYVGLLYQNLIRSGNAPPNRKLPPVLPIVLYNGGARWTAATDVADMIAPVPGLVMKYQPQLAHLVIDEGRFSEAELAPMKNLAACMMRLGHAKTDDAVIALVDQLHKWIGSDTELSRTFALWIRAVLSQQSGHTLSLSEADDLESLKMSLAQRFDEWAHEHEDRGMRKGIEQGMEQGVQKGEARVLRMLLTQRFGPLPPDLEQRIDAAPAEQINIWVNRFLGADRLKDVFGP